jgi:hypothetical protein
MHNGPGMTDTGTNERYLKFRVAVRACENGQYVYQLFTLAGGTRTFQTDDKSYDTPEEAVQACYEALAVLTAQPL